MKIPIYQVDAFTDKAFGGNPAAVCPLSEWLPDELLQQIGMENNLSETAFLVKENDGYRIRWFTPSVEVDLCGHATLASAAVLFHQWGIAGDEISFYSRSGLLKVRNEINGKLTLDFPGNKPQPAETPAFLLEGLGLEAAEVMKGAFDYMVVLEEQHQVEGLEPDFRTLKQVGSCRGVVVTARGLEVDFVSRCFYPQSGIDEDPVTGSAHTMMIPYWAEKLGKTKLSAIQLSKRKGYIDGELYGDRVLMSGNAVTYMKGEIEL